MKNGIPLLVHTYRQIQTEPTPISSLTILLARKEKAKQLGTLVSSLAVPLARKENATWDSPMRG